jgi:predicted Zn-dependent peptidase
MTPASLHVLKNGVRVVLAPCEAESVAFGLFVASGSRHEDAKSAGISHFIEHMLFKGTPSRKPVDITRAIEGRGGNFNACTSEESTCYYAHLPSEYLAEAVEILSDMYLNASIPPDEFAREKQVVVEEIRMYSDEPDVVAAENLQRALFPDNALGAPVAGTPESLAPMTPDTLHRYMRSHYLPGNTVAVVAGSFDESAALALVELYLGGLRRKAKPFSPEPVDFGRQPAGSVTATKDINQTQLAIGYRTFGVNDERRYAATVMDAVLGRGMSSRLFQEVRERRGLSYDISSRMQFFTDAGMLTITAGLDGSRLDMAARTIDRELARLRDRRVGAQELRRTKEFLIGNFRLSHEKVTSKMFFYGSTMLSFGHLVTPQDQIEKISSVTAAEIQSVACDILRPECRCTSIVTPRGADPGHAVI